MEPALHPDCESLAFLLGTWRGEGEGEWPRGEPFRYGEGMTFEHVGDAFLSTRSGAGCSRTVPRCTSSGGSSARAARAGSRTTGSPVTVLQRHLEVHGDRLRNELHMAMHEVAVMRHLAAELSRV